MFNCRVRLLEIVYFMVSTEQPKLLGLRRVAVYRSSE